MATATIETIETEYDHCVVLHGVDWKGYSTLLRLRGERSVPRIVYLDGTVWFMSPAFPHERLKFKWVSRSQTEYDNVWITDVRNWVKRTLRPRVRGQNKKRR